MNPSTPPPGAGFNIDVLVTWAWIVGLSLLGGVASFLQKMKTWRVRTWNFTEFVGEITAAGLTDIITGAINDKH